MKNVWLQKRRQQDAFEKCFDFSYFCENYVKTCCSEPTYSLFDFQKRYVRALQENRYVICSKFRQGGFSTITSLYLLWRCLFTNEHQYILKSRKAECNITTSLLLNVLEQLPRWIKGQTCFKRNNCIEFSLTNSSITIDTPAPMRVRGRRIDTLMIDEAAFFSNMKHVWESYLPCLYQSGRAIVVSNPNGTIDEDGDLNWFFQMYKNAKEGKSDFSVFECNYMENPYYHHKEVVRKLKENLDKYGWQQEVEAKFTNPEYDG